MRWRTGVARIMGGAMLVALGVVSCEAFFPLDELGPGTGADAAGAADADAPGEASVDAPAVDGDARSVTCPNDGAGPTMIAAGPFCVDATEVTNAQYLAFLQAKGGDAGGQPSFCSWNVDLTPGASCWPFATGAEDEPVACVDWCDALGFCAWAGKRLCGRIGGGPMTSAEFAAVPTNDQWYAACSRAGVLKLPYGDVYEPSACNGFDLGKGKVVRTGSLPGCQGGYPSVFDMSGNVYEWVDSCEQSVGATDSCFDRGGSFRYPPDAGRFECKASSVKVPRNSQFQDTGFRCCAP